MNDFTFEEQNLVCIYNSSGTRAGVIAALTEMRGYLEPDEDELRCQRQCDFVIFRRTGNVRKWRIKVCSL